MLGELLRLARPGEAWLDVGAGAGRFALPIARALARHVGRWSPRPVGLDAGGLPEAPRSTRSRTSRPRAIAAGRSARAPGVEADVALIAHVGYDIEAIGPFVDALEAAPAVSASPS